MERWNVTAQGCKHVSIRRHNDPYQPREHRCVALASSHQSCTHSEVSWCGVGCVHGVRCVRCVRCVSCHVMCHSPATSLLLDLRCCAPPWSARWRTRPIRPSTAVLSQTLRMYGTAHSCLQNGATSQAIIFKKLVMSSFFLFLELNGFCGDWFGRSVGSSTEKPLGGSNPRIVSRW